MTPWSFSFILLKLFLGCLLYNQLNSALISRGGWGAQNPIRTWNLQTPVLLVTIHHTADNNGPCWSPYYCKRRVKGYHNYDMDQLSYSDIRWNFLVGYDGNSYEGRGWNKIGYHSGSDNSRSIGITFIGNFNSRTPSSTSLNVLKDLIRDGVAARAVGSNCQVVVRSGTRLTTPVNALGHCAGILGNTAPAPAPAPPPTSALTIISRASWGARRPKSITSLRTPVSMVVIHHTTGESCSNLAACKSRVRGIQNYHMDITTPTKSKWSDIGYNFLIGGDGRAYEGRGWDTKGAHARPVNDRSIGIAFIGEFTSVYPTSGAISQVKLLIAEGVRRGKIRSNYQLKGHLDVGSTACPGNMLYTLVTRRFQ